MQLRVQTFAFVHRLILTSIKLLNIYFYCTKLSYVLLVKPYLSKSILYKAIIKVCMCVISFTFREVFKPLSLLFYVLNQFCTFSNSYLTFSIFYFCSISGGEHKIMLIQLLKISILQRLWPNTTQGVCLARLKMALWCGLTHMDALTWKVFDNLEGF